MVGHERPGRYPFRAARCGARQLPASGDRDNVLRPCGPGALTLPVGLRYPPGRRCDATRLAGGAAVHLPTDHLLDGRDVAAALPGYRVGPVLARPVLPPVVPAARADAVLP